MAFVASKLTVLAKLLRAPFPLHSRYLSTTRSESTQLGAIVTGGASGIGAATCKKLASRGINIVVADLQADRGHAFAAELSSTYSIDAQFISLDVTKEEDVKRMVEFATKRWGRIDYAANCAGICLETSWDEEESVSTSAVDRAFQINQRGVWLCQKYEALQMQKQEPLAVKFTPSSAYPIAPQRGAIVNVSSMSGLSAMGLAAYTPTKYAVLGITKNGAKFYGPRGIRCNAICPGLTLTKMLEVTFGKEGQEGSEESQNSQFLASIPLRRMAFAQEQANVISFLLSSEASYINGAHIVVDGGFTDVR